jgi:heat shock protein HslJ
MKGIAGWTVALALVSLQQVTFEGTAWRLVALPGHPPEAIAALKRAISIRFESGRVSGFSGCNAFNGPYTLDQSRVTFGDLAGTMMACGEPGVAGLEETFRRVLAGRAAYTIAGDRLTLKTEAGAILIFEKEARATLDGNAWSITAYLDGRQGFVDLPSDAALTLTFENGRASGQAGCNSFQTTYEIDANTLKFAPIATTRRMCPATLMVQERDLLEAIASANRWVIEGNVLHLWRADGVRVLTANRR